MTRHDPPDTVLRAWGSEPLPVEDAARADERRDKIVPRLATVMREAGRRRERTRALRWAGSGFAAAAAIALAVVGLASLRAPDPQAPSTSAVAIAGPRWQAARGVEVVRDGRSVVGTEVGGTASLPLVAGDAIVTSAGAEGVVTMGSGATLEVHPGTAMRVVAPEGSTERVEIGRGGAEVRVPELQASNLLRVGTPGVEISGAAAWFTVQIADVTLGGARTTVQVRAGSVTVEYAGRRVVLSAGGTWTGPPPPNEGAPKHEDDAPAKRDDRAPSRAAQALDRSAAESGPASRLAEQNRLFQAAMSHKRRGDDRAVIGALDELLARHRDSPFAQEARVERMRALARLGDKTGAARDARRYLAEHGDGFAKDEAREVALEPTAAPSVRPAATKP